MHLHELEVKSMDVRFITSNLASILVRIPFLVGAWGVLRANASLAKFFHVILPFHLVLVIYSFAQLLKIIRQE